MKQMTKQELIELIKEKQANARQMFENLLYADNATEKTNELQRANLVGEQKRAIDIIALLESTEIVNDTLCPTCKDKDTCYHKQRSGKEAVKCTEYNPVTKADGNVVERVERKNNEDDKKPIFCQAPSNYICVVACCEQCCYYSNPKTNEFAEQFSQSTPKPRYLFEVRRIFIEPEKINGGIVFSELTQIVCTEDEVEDYMRQQQGKTNTYSVQIKSKREIY